MTETKIFSEKNLCGKNWGQKKFWGSKKFGSQNN